MILIVIADLTLLKTSMRGLQEHIRLEVWWTVVPGFILVALAVPSLSLLYLIDEVELPDITINVLGHQWFWEYNYPDFDRVTFESYIVANESEMVTRLLDVDNRVVVPINALIRLLISSTDVLHSWAMPSLGVKVDAVPGRLNQLTLASWAPGLAYGQCSEICGANHRFMPIVLEMIRKSDFMKWVSSWK